jgi:hypothetical protein
MIPLWNLAGLIPPIRPGEEGHGTDRSPYNATFSEVIEHFGVTPDRLAILTGLLEYRQALYGIGITAGFQWLDGSFVENVETLKERSPNDIDVVTFFRLPGGQTQDGLFEQAQHLFDIQQTKQQYRVDGYPMILGEQLEDWHVDQISYWYSMWSHTRDGNWKGFVRVGLDPDGDEAASQLLQDMQEMEVVQ